MENLIYLDWASTAVPEEDLIYESVRASVKSFANPSSIHKPGKEAKELLERSRKMIADTLNCKPENIIFTSGGTESNNTILFSTLKKGRQNGIVISGIEHSSVFEPAKTLKEMGIPVRIVPADQNGIVSPEKIARVIDKDTYLVSVMTVNNETGAIQPVKEIGELIRRREEHLQKNIHFHTDAVQAFGKIPFIPEDLGVDSASISAHKIGGPRGVGALYLKKPLAVLYCGGGQERGLRPGTENIQGIYGFTLAAERRNSRLKEEFKRACELKEYILDSLSSLNGCIFISGRDHNSYSPYIINVSFVPLPGEVLVRVLSDRGIAISTGSACSSAHKKKRLRILENMGQPKQIAESAIRISFGPSTQKEEIDEFLDILKKEVNSLQRVAVKL